MRFVDAPQHLLLYIVSGEGLQGMIAALVLWRIFEALRYISLIAPVFAPLRGTRLGLPHFRHFVALAAAAAHLKRYLLPA